MMSEEEHDMRYRNESIAVIAGWFMILIGLVIVGLCAGGCGDDLRPDALPDAQVSDADASAPDAGPLLWSDANQRIAVAVCGWAGTCDPLGLEFYYGGNVAYCEQFEAEDLCVVEGYSECGGLYPERLKYYLEQCEQKALEDARQDARQAACSGVPQECRQAEPS